MIHFDEIKGESCDVCSIGLGSRVLGRGRTRRRALARAAVELKAELRRVEKLKKKESGV